MTLPALRSGASGNRSISAVVPLTGCRGDRQTDRQTDSVPFRRNCQAKLWCLLVVMYRTPDMELGHILWPSDPVTRESSDPETQLTWWSCSIMNSKCRLMLQTDVCNGKEVCQFLSLFGVCTLLGSRGGGLKFWRSLIKCQYFNDGSTDFHKNILTRKNSGLTPGQNDDPVTWTWKMTHWPGYPMAQFHVWCSTPHYLLTG